VRNGLASAAPLALDILCARLEAKVAIRRKVVKRELLAARTLINDFQERSAIAIVPVDLTVHTLLGRSNLQDQLSLTRGHKRRWDAIVGNSASELLSEDQENKKKTTASLTITRQPSSSDKKARPTT
jgi:hypothetical protein